MKGTRAFILEEARSWMEDPNAPQIFGLADVAGSGKSTVANRDAVDFDWSRPTSIVVEIPTSVSRVEGFDWD
jgi:hypothetical protein